MASAECQPRAHKSTEESMDVPLGAENFEEIAVPKLKINLVINLLNNMIFGH